MEIVWVLALCFLGIVVFLLVRAFREGDGAAPSDLESVVPSPAPSAPVAHSELYDAVYAATYERVLAQEVAFQAMLDRLAEETGGDYFFSKLVGVTFRNDDGTQRQKFIADLGPHDELVLVHEPENIHDKDAVRVETDDGNQLGYLDRRLAGEVVRSFGRGGKWRCFVSEVTGEDKRKQGVNIAMLRY